jgi:hypothetical protein
MSTYLPKYKVLRTYAVTSPACNEVLRHDFLTKINKHEDIRKSIMHKLIGISKVNIINGNFQMTCFGRWICKLLWGGIIKRCKKQEE